MSDAVAVPAAVMKKKSPKKASKPKKPAEHPVYISMVKSAIKALADRKGSSRMAIVKYIMANFKVERDDKRVGSRVKVALRNGVKSAALKQVKGVGASGSFKLGEKKEVKPKVKKPKSPKKAKKPKSPKKAKKPTADGTPKVKKARKPKTPKKAGAAKPKPKKVKTPKKPAAAKKVKSPAKKAKASKPKTPKKAKAVKA